MLSHPLYTKLEMIRWKWVGLMVRPAYPDPSSNLHDSCGAGGQFDEWRHDMHCAVAAQINQQGGAYA